MTTPRKILKKVPSAPPSPYAPAEEELITQSSVAELLAIQGYDIIEHYESRMEFIFAALLYCLNMGNLWRFPQNAVLHGEGAYVWLYVFFTLTFGVPIMFLEFAIGQYTAEGLVKVFTKIPLFEGLSMSMMFYCNTIVHIYNMINVYNFIFMFTFVRPESPLSSKLSYEQWCIVNPDTNASMESLHFHNEVYMVPEDMTCIFNGRNLAVSAFLWVLTWVFASKQYTHLKYFPTTIYTVVVIFLIVTALGCLSIVGCFDGMKRMFVPMAHQFQSFETYTHAFEQSLVTLGLGMGPFINIGAATKLRSPVLKNSIIVSVCTVFMSFTVGVVLFTAVGAVDLENGREEELEGPEYNFFVLTTKNFLRMDTGYQHINVLIFHLALLLVGFYITIKDVELAMDVIKAKFKFNPDTNTRTIFFICACQAGLSSCTVNYLGYGLLQTGTQHFIVISVLTLITFELCAMFVYGLENFSNDCEFMTGTRPNYFLKAIWIITPPMNMIVIVLFVYHEFEDGDFYDLFSGIIYITLIIMPVVIMAVMNSVTAYKHGELKRVLRPKEIDSAFEDYWQASRAGY